MSPNFDAFVSVYSNLHDYFQTTVCSVLWEHSTSAAPTVTRLIEIEVPRPTSQLPFPANPPELFSFTNSTDETAYGIYFLPPAFDPSKRYPTLLYVYGGPHVQLITNSYSITQSHKRYQMLASEGYVSVVIDGLGSWNRGLKWEGHIRCRMGTSEMADQVLGLQHLITKGIVDPERIAVTGWSYGGYMSLMCLAQRGDFFKLAIAGGPVTLWEAYDTGYTERYMDTPQNNPSGYQTGSVLNYVVDFPDEENRLLIVHGAIDENVHFCNTAKLIDALIEKGKPYQIQIFPSERHGVRSSIASLHWEMAFFSFLKNYL